MDLSVQLVKKLTPFLAIHWRMETVDVNALEACGAVLIKSLEATLSETARNKDIQTVYLATDYPFADEAKPRSGTFGSVKQQQKQAIMNLRKAFASSGPLSRWHLQYLEKVLVEQFGAPRLARGDLAAAIGDLGLMGVLDKNIVIGAELFLSAAEGCGKLR
jgi:hypothetical protein